MNYRHAFHAGNHADVLKHIVLLALVERLKRKPSAFFVLDTHAGRGRYVLEDPTSQKTGEYLDGIGRLLAQAPSEKRIAAYLDAVVGNNPNPRLQIYPGSPLLIAQHLRKEDGLVACELQPEEARILKTVLSQIPQAAVHQRDGYEAIKALLPPRFERQQYGRGLILIDPPYEIQQEEYSRILEAVTEIDRRWPQAIVAIWYPIKQRRSLTRFFRDISTSSSKPAQWIELLIRPDDSPLRLNGSGMIIINPPWQFDSDLAPVLPILSNVLGEANASWRLSQAETASQDAIR